MVICTLSKKGFIVMGKMADSIKALTPEPKEVKYISYSPTVDLGDRGYSIGIKDSKDVAKLLEKVFYDPNSYDPEAEAYTAEAISEQEISGSMITGVMTADVEREWMSLETSPFSDRCAMYCSYSVNRDDLEVGETRFADVCYTKRGANLKILDVEPDYHPEIPSGHRVLHIGNPTLLRAMTQANVESKNEYGDVIMTPYSLDLTDAQKPLVDCSRFIIEIDGDDAAKYAEIDDFRLTFDGSSFNVEGTSVDRFMEMPASDYAAQYCSTLLEHYEDLGGSIDIENANAFTKSVVDVVHPIKDEPSIRRDASELDKYLPSESKSDSLSLEV